MKKSLVSRLFSFYVWRSKDTKQLIQPLRGWSDIVGHLCLRLHRRLCTFKPFRLGCANISRRDQRE